MPCPENTVATVAGGNQPGLLQAMGVAVYTTDAEGRLTAYNEAAVALWGQRPPLREACWCGSWRLYRPDGAPLPHEQCPMAVALREGRPLHGAEAVAERPDGTRIPFMAYPAPLRDADGAIVGAINVLVDISDRRGTEAALAASAARLRAVFETTPECIKLVAQDGTLLQMNSAGLGMIQAGTHQQVEGGSVLNLIAPEHRVAWRANHERVCRGEALSWEFDIIGLQGARRRMETHATPLHLPDGQVAQLAITRDVTARKQAEERQRLLMREVDHRAKNALAVALSLLRLTRAEDPTSFAEAVEGRIAALANAHDLLAKEGWSGAELRAVAQAELGSCGATGRVELRGPAAWLMPTAVQPVSMVLHELATNALKYGALSAPGGRVVVEWSTSPASGTLELHWRESGGPALAGPPERRSFGSQLIDATVPGQLGGEVRRRWEPGGLQVEITVSAKNLQPPGRTESDALPLATPRDRRPFRGLAGRRVLIAEDELLVAMEVAQTLRDLGCEVLGPAATVEEALRLAQAEAGTIDAAVLDVNLAGRPSFPAADILAGQGVPVVFATGYGDLPEGQAGDGRTVLLRKPLRRGELEAVLTRILLAAPPDIATG